MWFQYRTGFIAIVCLSFVVSQSPREMSWRVFNTNGADNTRVNVVNFCANERDYSEGVVKSWNVEGFEVTPEMGDQNKHYEASKDSNN